MNKPCPHCGALNDPVESVGYCDACGKKLPGLNVGVGASTLERRRQSDSEDPSPNPSRRTWNEAAVLLAIVALLQLGVVAYRFLDADRQAQVNIELSQSDDAPSQRAMLRRFFQDMAAKELRVRVVLFGVFLYLAFLARRHPLRAAWIALGGYALFTLGWLGGLGPYWLLWDPLFEGGFFLLLLVAALPLGWLRRGSPRLL